MDLSQKEWIDKVKSTDNAIIIDVRTPEECANGMIMNAFAIDIYKGQQFIDEINQLDKSAIYFLYCKAGGRSAQACALMNQLGFEKTYNLVGGVTQWKGELQ